LKYACASVSFVVASASLVRDFIKDLSASRADFCAELIPFNASTYFCNFSFAVSTVFALPPVSSLSFFIRSAKSSVALAAGLIAVFSAIRIICAVLYTAAAAPVAASPIRPNDTAPICPTVSISPPKKLMIRIRALFAMMMILMPLIKSLQNPQLFE
jgi:hypothetical protein